MGIKIVNLVEVLLIILSASSAFGLFETCDKTVTIAAGQTVAVNSDNPVKSSCRYVITTVPDYQLVASCYIAFPISNGQCYATDQFAVSFTGDSTFTQAQILCGVGSFQVTSSNNSLALAYLSSNPTFGEYFNCTVTATCDCGWGGVGSRIVGGSPTTPNQFTPQVALKHIPDSLVFCGATIISRRYIQSAAHCFQTYSVPSDISAIVGFQNIAANPDTPYTTSYSINLITIHPLYSSTTNKNDIAILRTVSSIVWNNGVAPACLPFSYTNTSFVGSLVQVAGVGTTSFGGPTSSNLLVASLNVVCGCAISYPNINYNYEICTNTTGADACQYDSGGSLWYRAQRLYTVGVISHGTGCATKNGAVSTRVSAYIPWIQSVTPGVNYCNR